MPDFETMLIFLKIEQGKAIFLTIITERPLIFAGRNGINKEIF
jgi:hypothetical protein